MTATSNIFRQFSPAIRLSFFFFALFFLVGVYMPFFPVWLATRGLSSTEIGVLLALPMAMRIVSTPFVGAFADRMAEPRSALLLFAVMAALLFAGIGFSDDFIVIAVMLALTAVFWMPLTPLSDAFALSIARRDGRDYGRMRLWGSLAFILANLGAGWLVGRYSGGVVHQILIFGFALIVTASYLLPHSVARTQVSPAEEKADRKSLRRPVFLAVVFLASLIQASHALVYGFGSLYWRSLGFTGTEIGALWAIGVIAEILLFSISGRVVARLGPLRLIAVAATAAIVRWALFPSLLHFHEFLAVQVLHGLTFGAAHLGLVHHVAQSVPERLAGAGQGIAVTIITASMAVAMVVSGPLYRGFGGDGFYAMAAVGAVALLLAGVIGWVTSALRG